MKGDTWLLCDRCSKRDVITLHMDDDGTIRCPHGEGE